MFVDSKRDFRYVAAGLDDEVVLQCAVLSVKHEIDVRISGRITDARKLRNVSYPLSLVWATQIV